VIRLIYENVSDQAAFDRWVDVMAELLLKYGPACLKTLNESDMPAAVSVSILSHEQDDPLEDTLMAA
jgi:hypothetical protein